jgi:hypothetical protein
LLPGTLAAGIADVTAAAAAAPCVAGANVSGVAIG